MKFKSFYQHSYKTLILSIISKSELNIKIFSITILCLRLLTFGFYFNLGDSKNDLKFKKRGSHKFVLDLRDAKLNLHLLGILSQFFVDIKKNYINFSILINENTFSLNPLKMYDKEFYSLLKNFKKVVKFNLIQSPKSYNLENCSYIKISKKDGYKLNGIDFNESLNLKKIFNNYFLLTSQPINFKFPQKKNKEYSQLTELLKKNFTLIFYPTSDINMKFENYKRRYGVINKKNFNMLKKIYINILNEIDKRNILDFKIILLNKKSLNWSTNKNILDLRSFENYGINFAEMLGLLNNTCNWTMGSEGTLQYYLMLSPKLKHVVMIDNSHWKFKNAYGSAVPQFYDGSGIIYKQMPKNFVPTSSKQVLKKIFDDYKKFKSSKKLFFK